MSEWKHELSLVAIWDWWATLGCSRFVPDVLEEMAKRIADELEQQAWAKDYSISLPSLIHQLRNSWRPDAFFYAVAELYNWAKNAKIRIYS